VFWGGLAAVGRGRPGEARLIGLAAAVQVFRARGAGGRCSGAGWGGGRDVARLAASGPPAWRVVWAAGVSSRSVPGTEAGARSTGDRTRSLPGGGGELAVQRLGARPGGLGVATDRGEAGGRGPWGLAVAFVHRGADSLPHGRRARGGVLCWRSSWTEPLVLPQHHVVPRRSSSRRCSRRYGRRCSRTVAREGGAGDRGLELWWGVLAPSTAAERAVFPALRRNRLTEPRVENLAVPSHSARARRVPGRSSSGRKYGRGWRSSR